MKAWWMKRIMYEGKNQFVSCVSVRFRSNGDASKAPASTSDAFTVFDLNLKASVIWFLSFLFWTPFRRCTVHLGCVSTVSSTQLRPCSCLCPCLAVRACPCLCRVSQCPLGHLFLDATILSTLVHVYVLGTHSTVGFLFARVRTSSASCDTTARVSRGLRAAMLPVRSCGCFPRLCVGGLGHLVCCSDVSRELAFSRWNPSVLSTLRIALTRCLSGGCKHVLSCMDHTSCAIDANSRSHGNLLLLSRWRSSHRPWGQTTRERVAERSRLMWVRLVHWLPAQSAPKPLSLGIPLRGATLSRTFGSTPATQFSTFLARTWKSPSLLENTGGWRWSCFFFQYVVHSRRLQIPLIDGQGHVQQVVVASVQCLQHYFHDFEDSWDSLSATSQEVWISGLVNNFFNWACQQLLSPLEHVTCLFADSSRARRVSHAFHECVCLKTREESRTRPSAITRSHALRAR